MARKGGKTRKQNSSAQAPLPVVTLHQGLVLVESEDASALNKLLARTAFKKALIMKIDGNRVLLEGTSLSALLSYAQTKGLSIRMGSKDRDPARGE